jgi:hypothetical protein
MRLNIYIHAKAEPANDGGQHWVTINGAPVLISGDGEVVGGAGGAFNGQNLSDIKPSSDKPSSSGDNLEKIEGNAPEEIKQKIKNTHERIVKDKITKEALTSKPFKVITEHSDKIKYPNKSDGTPSGWHNPNTGDIGISTKHDDIEDGDGKLRIGKGNSNCDYSGQGIYRHEVGHKVLLSQEKNKEFNKDWNKASKSFGERTGATANANWSNKLYAETRQDITRNHISAYAGTNKDELFAESYSAYKHEDYGKDGNKLPPELDDFMSKWIK